MSKMATLAHTSILTKMYIFLQKGVNLYLYLITIYTKNWIVFLEFTKYRNKANLAISSPLRSQMRPIISASKERRLPVPVRYLKRGIPRRGEQRPVVEFSYMGYSPPKCTCNGTPNIQAKQICSYSNVYMIWIRMRHTLSHFSSPH